MIEESKEEIIKIIKELISIDGESIEINPNYLEYFEIEELFNIKEELLSKKENRDKTTKEYVDELYEKCS